MYSPSQTGLHQTKKAGDFSNKNSQLEQRLEGACLRRLFHEKNQFNNFLCQQGEITSETKTFDNLKFVLFVYPHPTYFGANHQTSTVSDSNLDLSSSIFETAIKASEPCQLEDWVVVLLV